MLFLRPKTGAFPETGKAVSAYPPAFENAAQQRKWAKIAPKQCQNECLTETLGVLLFKAEIHIYAFDLNVFRKNRTEFQRTQPLSESSCDDGIEQSESMSALLKKFSSALSVCDKYSFQSDPRFAWVDEMENDELYRKIISLPERDIDLLTLIAFEGYSQREVAEIRGIAPAAICKKIAKLKKLLYGG